MRFLSLHYRLQQASSVALLFASLTPLSLLHQNRSDSDAFSHGTTTCREEKDASGIRLILTQTNLCGANLYPRLEIEIRQLPLKIQKNIIIGPDNWAFRCPSANEPCEQFVSGKIVFDHLENGSTARSKTEGRYELRLRGGAGVVERGNFKVDCVLPCNRDSQMITVLYSDLSGSIRPLRCPFQPREFSPSSIRRRRVRRIH
jgi:hypothetical protein